MVNHELRPQVLRKPLKVSSSLPLKSGEVPSVKEKGRRGNGAAI